jgi:hypothetical protein
MPKPKVRRIILNDDDWLGDYVRWPPDAPAISFHRAEIATVGAKRDGTWTERWLWHCRTVLKALGLKRY